MDDKRVELGLRRPCAEVFVGPDLVLPVLGELRLQVVTVRRLDRFVQTLQLHSGSATAKIARTVASGVLGLAVRHGAIPANPVRDIAPIASKPRRQHRALTPDERREWIARLNADEDAVCKDLPDLCEWMLGTGVRIGEVLSVSWDDVDLTASTSRSTTRSPGSRASASSARPSRAARASVR